MCLNQYILRNIPIRCFIRKVILIEGLVRSRFIFGLGLSGFFLHDGEIIKAGGGICIFISFHNQSDVPP